MKYYLLIGKIKDNIFPQYDSIKKENYIFICKCLSVGYCFCIKKKGIQKFYQGTSTSDKLL